MKLHEAFQESSFTGFARCQNKIGSRRPPMCSRQLDQRDGPKAGALDPEVPSVPPPCISLYKGSC